MAATDHIERVGWRAAEGDWRRLARGGDVFSSPEWAALWWQHHGRGEPIVYVVRRAGRVVAVVPLYADWGVLRFVGSPHADRLGPVCEDVATGAWALQEIARRRRRLVLADRLPGEAGWQHHLVGGQRLACEASPRLVLTGSYEAWLQAQGAATRREIRRRERRLLEQGAIFRRLEAEEAVTSGVDVLLGLHALRWGSESTVDGDFVRAEVRLAARNGWLRLWLVEVQGEPVAASLALRYHGREYLSVTGRDPAWTRASAGSALLHHTVRDAFAGGVTEYHLLRGDQEYKARYANADDGVHSWAVGAAPMTWMARAAVAAVRRGPTAIRHAAYSHYGL
jgi:CelD/BcsL family acetyltransferase involved in cellulose biosynthesis